MQGEHSFRVEQVIENQVIFYQEENFNGILVPFFDFSNTKKGFQAMNQALKVRVESSGSRE
ncbi:MAG: hypothetical protein AAF518_21855 [Spirochaetota bacterium]